MNLDAFQSRQVETKVAEFDETVTQRIAETYQWVLNPDQPPADPTGPMHWDTFRLPGVGACRSGAGAESLAERVSRKLVAEEALIAAYAGSRLRHDIDRVPLWRGGNVAVRQLWDDFTQYLYLPRLLDRSVLEGAVRDGVASLTWRADGFAYADDHDPATPEPSGIAGDGSGARYRGLRAAQELAALAPSGLVVHPDVAAAQLAAELGATDTPDGPGGPASPETGTGPAAPEPDAPSLPTRYWGRVTLDSLHWTRTAADIADAIVDQLARAHGAEVEVTIEVEGTSPSGFDDAVRRTVTENAATLKFTSGDFEA